MSYDHYRDNDEEAVDLMYPPLYVDDIEQERELLILQGVENPSRYIIAQKLGHRRELLYKDILPRDATPLISNEDPVPDFETIDKLVRWAFTQPKIIKEAIIAFLGDPSEENLEEVTKFLSKMGIIQKKDKKSEAPSAKETSLTALIIRTITNQPTTLQDLYSLARREISSKRPEAAVRQIIRRQLSDGKIATNNHGEYYVL